MNARELREALAEMPDDAEVRIVSKLGIAVVRDGVERVTRSAAGGVVVLHGEADDSKGGGS